MARHERLYRYVGPEAIRSRSASAPGGTPIERQEALRAWLDGQDVPRSVVQVVATFVIDPEGVLRLADRRSEHVACAVGGPVLSAGEMFFSSRGKPPPSRRSEPLDRLLPRARVVACGWRGPGPDRSPPPRPVHDRVVFRRCPHCGERNVVKDGWLECEVCGGELPEVWNFDPETNHG